MRTNKLLYKLYGNCGCVALISRRGVLRSRGGHQGLLSREEEWGRVKDVLVCQVRTCVTCHALCACVSRVCHVRAFHVSAAPIGYEPQLLLVLFHGSRYVSAMETVVLSGGMVLQGNLRYPYSFLSLLESADLVSYPTPYVFPTRCLVLTEHMALPPYRSLRCVWYSHTVWCYLPTFPYTVSGTDTPYGGTKANSDPLAFEYVMAVSDYGFTKKAYAPP
eukprot:3940809-Rhodomonas_salina.1